MPTGTENQKKAAPRLTRAKIKTIELLAEYFCLRTNDLGELERGQAPSHDEARSLRHTLGLLYRDGLAKRLPYLELDRDHGRTTYVYGLSDKGVEFCKSLWPNAKTFDEHSQRTLDHELEISFFHIALKKFAATNKLKLYWQQADLKCTVSPDAMFALTDPQKPDGKNTLYYFLELERAKIGHYVKGEPSIMTKLGRYYEYYGTDKCEKEWTDFRQFRVIVVQRTDERRTNLLKALNTQYNHRMFWLTDELSYKENVGGQIFHTPRDYQNTTYSLHLN
jgi:hypothetical protein